MGVKQGLPKGGRVLAGAEGHPGPCEEGVGGCELLEGSESGCHGTVRRPGDGGNEEGYRLSRCLDSLGGGDGDPQAAGSRHNILPLDGVWPTPRVGERGFDCLIRVK